MERARNCQPRIKAVSREKTFRCKVYSVIPNSLRWLNKSLNEVVNAEENDKLSNIYEYTIKFVPYEVRVECEKRSFLCQQKMPLHYILSMFRGSLRSFPIYSEAPFSFAIVYWCSYFCWVWVELHLWHFSQSKWNGCTLLLWQDKWIQDTSATYAI